MKKEEILISDAGYCEPIEISKVEKPIVKSILKALGWSGQVHKDKVLAKDENGSDVVLMAYKEKWSWRVNRTFSVYNNNHPGVRIDLQEGQIISAHYTKGRILGFTFNFLGRDRFYPFETVNKWGILQPIIYLKPE